jgi:integrase
VLEATLGLRLGDVLSLKMESFLKDGQRWRLDVVEKKTGKAREFTVPDEVFSFIQNYAYEQNISKKAKLFDISARQVERFLEGVCFVLGYHRVSTHSFRKYFSTQIYIKSNYNLILVQRLLQHSSVETTRRYIGIGSKEIEEALKQHIGLI